MARVMVVLVLTVNTEGVNNQAVLLWSKMSCFVKLNGKRVSLLEQCKPEALKAWDSVTNRV